MPYFQAEQIFLPVLVRLSVLVFQPPPTLSGHRSMFTQALQPEIWWVLVHASVWLCWMHRYASSRVTSYIKHELWQGNQRIYNTTLRRVTALEARNPFKTLWIFKHFIRRPVPKVKHFVFFFFLMSRFDFWAGSEAQFILQEPMVPIKAWDSQSSARDSTTHLPLIISWRS